MGFFDKILNKAIVPNRIIFDNFADNYQLNLNRVKYVLDKVTMDMRKIRNMRFAPIYMEEMLKENEDQQQQIIYLSGSKNFSGPLSYILDCQKWYALYFMNTDKGKTDKERKVIIDSLQDLFELSIFITIKHFAFDRNEKLEWKDNAFWYRKDSAGKEVVKLVVENLEILLLLKTAVQAKDNTKVFEAYSKLKEFNIQLVKESPFPDF